MKQISPVEKAFVQGLFVASAFIAKAHGEDTMACEILTQHGYKFSDHRKYGVDETEVEVLRPLFRNRYPRNPVVRKGRVGK
jgi:hypothetical protein